MSLWAAAMANGYASQTWGTYKQWKDQGAQVRRDEKASPSVFYKQFETPDPDDDTKTRTMRLARMYWSFAAEQVDGAHVEPFEPMPEFQRNERAERFIPYMRVESPEYLFFTPVDKCIDPFRSIGERVGVRT